MNARPSMLLTGTAEILFLRGTACGFVLLAVAAIDLPRAALGLTAVLAAWAVATLVGMEREFAGGGPYVYNPLLVGLAVGFHSGLTWTTLLLAALAGVLTLAVTTLLLRSLSAAARLPILSLPFALVGIAIYLALDRLRIGEMTLATETLSTVASTGSPNLLAGDLGLPVSIAAFFKALGATLFAPYVIVGLVLAVTIVASSRILFVLAGTSFYLGAFVSGMIHGSSTAAWSDPLLFNYLLIGMALGGVLLVPSLQSFVVTMLAVAVAPLVLEALAAVTSAWGVPLFTLPFCLVTIGAYALLRLANYPLLAAGLGRDPEEVHENSIVNRLRYPGTLRTLSLPFAGRWTVWQAFNGRWTHKGIWRYAYDFVVTDDAGRTHRGDGQQLTDYYCYRLPVLAPVMGRVVRVLDQLPDNAVGQVAGGNNWGNLVIIHDQRGFYVELSHFAPKSIRVREGDWVERGMVLGLCGNSGYSPQPHIHLQVQETDRVGSATLPFSFVCFQQGDTYRSNEQPAEGAVVEQLCIDRWLDEATNPLLDDVQEYEVFCQGRLVDRLRLTVSVAADGSYYFESPRGRLYFGKHEGTLYGYRVTGDDPHLRRLLLAMPRVPLAHRPNAEWHDYLPASTLLTGSQLFLARLASLFVPRLAAVRVQQRFDGRALRSRIEVRWLGVKIDSFVEFDPRGWFAAAKVGDYELRRLPAVENLQPIAPRARQVRRRLKNVAVYAAACLLAIVVCGGAVQRSRQHDTLLPAIYNSVKLEKSFNYTGAVQALTPLLSDHRGDYLLNVRLGWLYYMLRDYTKSEEYYRAAIAISPKSLEARQGCTLPALANARYAEAETITRELLEHDPQNYLGHLRLAVALRLQQKYGDARIVTDRLREAYPTDASVLAEIAALNVVQPPPDARPPNAKLTLAKTADDKNLDAEWNDDLKRSLALEQSRDYAGAIKALAPVRVKQPNNYLLNLRLGWLYYLQKQYTLSTKHYQAAIEARPKSREAQLGATIALIGAQRWSDLETLATDALETSPHDYTLNLRLAQALRSMKKLDAAGKVLEHLGELYPADVTIKADAAQIATAQHNSTTAQQLYRECLALSPDHVVARQHVQGW